MITIVQKIEGPWTPLSGVIAAMRMETCATLTRGDGTSEVVDVDPYPVVENLDISKVAAYVAAGIWQTADLDRYGLKAAESFVPAEGKRAIGQPHYEEREDGSIAEIYHVEDIPPPPEPVELTTAEKLIRAGFTEEELAEYIAKAGFVRQTHGGSGATGTSVDGGTGATGG